MTYSLSEPFCDWLNVTCSPDSSFLPEVARFLAYHFCPVAFATSNDFGSVTRYLVGSGKGVLVVETSKNFHSASASGTAVRELVRLGIFRDYVNILGSVGHNVTRLDVAVDIATDAPAYLRTLESKYPNDLFSFGRKSLRVTRVYSARATDMALTGTWYVGHRSSARITARVYDKQSESLEKRGEVLPPTTRIELTFKKDFNCSLYDVIMPKSLFYSHASPKLLEPPEGYIAPWSPRGLVPWVSTPKDHTLTLDRFDARVSHSPELQKIAELGAQFGEAGKAAVMRHFERLLSSAISEASSCLVEHD